MYDVPNDMNIFPVFFRKGSYLYDRSCRGIFLLSFFSTILFFSVSAQGLQVFRQGEEGYRCFRIPAIVKTNKGTLLAFAEARRKGCGDTGDIDLVCKRSEDGGKSWSAMSVIWDDGENTCGNPAPVVRPVHGFHYPVVDLELRHRQGTADHRSNFHRLKAGICAIINRRWEQLDIAQGNYK
jgi:hypothetical protein